MVKNIFYKNLYQTISFFSVVMVLNFFLLLGFIESLKYANSNGWFLLIISISLIILYFSIGFYWIFQQVELNKDGIEITLCGKSIKNVKWADVEGIKRTSVMKNPAYTVMIKGDKNINLDARKGIKSALLIFGNKEIINDK